MSLAIDVDQVTEVLLVDGWHAVHDKSFALDSYEFVWGTQTLQGGAMGFIFSDGTGCFISGPLTAILAVKGEEYSS